MPEWQQRMAKVLKMPASLPERKDLLGRYTLYGGRADMDPQGRMQLPDELRKAGLTNIEVKVSGEGNLLRVTCLDRLREYVHANPVTASLQEVWAAHGV
jgi:DNA-binding transcriptional regulator/RsmH inhibitor MraZ